MDNFTTNNYEMKRDIINFSKKICEGASKPESKFTMDMIYGISKSKDILLSSIAGALDEDTKKAYTIDRLSDNLKDGAEQLSDDVVIGKSNALITPYQSFEGSRTSDNDAFQATYDASVTGFDGQDILVADTNLPENECREVTIQYF